MAGHIPTDREATQREDGFTGWDHHGPVQDAVRAAAEAYVSWHEQHPEVPIAAIPDVRYARLAVEAAWSVWKAIGCACGRVPGNSQ